MPAAVYCTKDDIKNRAVKYTAGFEPTVTDAQLDDIIVESSEYARNIYSMNYDPAVIDAFDPDFPEAIVNLTALDGAVKVYERFGALNTDVDAQTVRHLRSERRTAEQAVRYSALYDTTGAIVPRNDIPTVDASDTFTGIEEVLDAPRY